MRRFGPQLQASDAGLLAYARGMVEWQSRNVCLFVFVLVTVYFLFEIGFCKYLLYNRTNGGGGGGSGRPPAVLHDPTIPPKPKALTWIPWALQG